MKNTLKKNTRVFSIGVFLRKKMKWLYIRGKKVDEENYGEDKGKKGNEENSDGVKSTKDQNVGCSMAVEAICVGFILVAHGFIIGFFVACAVFMDKWF